jgi:hypothetical protein
MGYQLRVSFELTCASEVGGNLQLLLQTEALRDLKIEHDYLLINYMLLHGFSQ